MNQLKLNFDIAPLTINHAYIFRGWRKFPTKEMKHFKQFICDEMLLHRGSVDLFRQNFDGVSPLTLKIDFYLTDFFTKKNRINLKSGDLDNFLKLSIDSIFEQLLINDALICKIIATKNNSQKNRIEVEISC